MLYIPYPEMDRYFAQFFPVRYFAGLDPRYPIGIVEDAVE